MEFVPSCFYVTFREYRDRSVEFSIKCVFISTEPINGRYERSLWTLLYPVSYSRYDNNYSRITNLCIPCRMDGVSISPEAVQYDSYLSTSKREFFCYKFGFVSAEDKRRFCRALDYYGICYDYNTIMDGLLF